MTPTRRHRAWLVRLATCRFLALSSAVRVQLVSSTTRQRPRRCVRRVVWVSIRMCKLKPRAKSVLLVNMRMLLGWGAARTVCLASTRLLLACGSARSAGWVGTLVRAHSNVQCARQAVVMWTVTRRHRVLLVRLVSTRVLSGRTALRVWQVGPMLMETQQRHVRIAGWASTLVLV